MAEISNPIRKLTRVGVRENMMKYDGFVRGGGGGMRDDDD